MDRYREMEMKPTAASTETVSYERDNSVDWRCWLKDTPTMPEYDWGYWKPDCFWHEPIEDEL
jgi:hypothetical protein